MSLCCCFRLLGSERNADEEFVNIKQSWIPALRATWVALFYFGPPTTLKRVLF